MKETEVVDGNGYPLQKGQRVRVAKGSRRQGEVLKVIAPTERYPLGTVEVLEYMRGGGHRTLRAETVFVQRRRRKADDSLIETKSEADEGILREKWAPAIKAMSKRIRTKK